MTFRQIITLLLIPGFFLATTCSRKEEDKSTASEREKNRTEKKQEKIAELYTDSKKSEHTIGDKIKFTIQLPDTISSDSVRIYVNDELWDVLNKNVKEKSITTNNFPVGGNNFRFEAYLSNGQTDVLYKRLTFKSNIIPKKYTAKIIKTYPHDPGAYTQGLFYEDRFLYEGTGNRGSSSLRKVNLSDGELINSLALPSQYFGEGITSYKDKIIQLTWTSRTGFVYDKERFKLINKVRYPTQGWGITTDGEKLIMSDGSSIIYFLDPEFFSEIGRIEVYDNNGPMKNLNELEYIDGKVYANIWQESYIIAFDPETGKVLEKIDCSNLVPEKYKQDNDNVLNGIAYDQKNGRIFMTGKRWSKVYQVKFIKHK